MATNVELGQLVDNWQDGATQTLPTYSELTSLGFAQAGDPVSGVMATRPGSAWFNLIAAMRVSVIRAAGMTPSTTPDPLQFLTALQSLAWIKDKTITAAMMADKSITSEKLANGSVTQDKLASGAIVFEKISSGTIATTSQAEEGTADNVLMTPAKVKAAFDAYSLNDLVHIAGAETITGNKTFTGQTTIVDHPLTLDGANISISNKDNLNELDKITKFAKGTTPTTGQSYLIRLLDSSGSSTLAGTLAEIGMAYTSSGDSYVQMVASDTTEGSTSRDYIEVRYSKSSGKFTTRTPTPETDASGKEIVNAEWLRNYVSTTFGAYVVERWRSGTEWYRVWSDGLIEQGGRVTVETSETNVTINLNKAFTGVSYVAIGMPDSGQSAISGGAGLLGVGARTTSSFVLRAVDGSGSGAITAGYRTWMAVGY